jgi:CMP-N-acetylneuraminic acid synthetase
MYIFTKDVITRLRRRIGEKPYILEVSEIEATDINNPVDFEIANAIYTRILSKQ